MILKGTLAIHGQQDGEKGMDEYEYMAAAVIKWALTFSGALILQRIEACFPSKYGVF